MIPALTAATGAPRVAAIEHPLSRPMGRVGDAAGQGAVLRAALEVLVTAEQFGTVVDLPFQWPEPRGKAMGPLPAEPPIATLCKKKPWNFVRLLRGDLPRDAAATGA
jgi:hypothetical protein